MTGLSDVSAGAGNPPLGAQTGAIHTYAAGTRLEDLAWLIHAEFQEMPGMRLTFDQMKRFWNLSTADCRTVLAYLLSAGLLRQGEDGLIART